MRSFFFVVILVFCHASHAQNIWQMNRAYQNQINQAQWMARPYYFSAYRPYYAAPQYYGPVGYGFYDDFDTAWEVRQLNQTIREIEGARRLDAIRNRPWR